MTNSWGKKIKMTVFGERCGPACGAVLAGLPAGLAINPMALRRQLKKSGLLRGNDEMQILSGLLAGRATGAPLTIVFPNGEPEGSLDQPGLMRPGHADYAAYVKYQGYNDYRGGGMLGARLPLILATAGNLLRPWLEDEGVVVGAHLQQVGTLEDESWADQGSFPTAAQVKALAGKRLPFNLEELALLADQELDKAAERRDGLGAVLEAAAVGLPTGLGGPWCGSLEGRLSSLLFAIPGVKAVEFGDGAAFAGMRGSQARDDYYLDRAGRPGLRANHNGGVAEGLATGAPLIVRAIFRPNPSLAGTQQGLDLQAGAAVQLTGEGHQDPCLGLKGLPAMEGVLILVLADLLLAECGGEIRERIPVIEAGSEERDDRQPGESLAAEPAAGEHGDAADT